MNTLQPSSIEAAVVQKTGQIFPAAVNVQAIAGRIGEDDTDWRCRTEQSESFFRDT
jgi:hypothetical protein